MVSIFSFFSKKRPKAAAAPASEDTRRPVTPPSPSTKHPQRVRSTRSKASTFKTEASRRASTDGPSKRKTPSTPPPQINIALPFEARASDHFDASLGLDSVGRTALLNASERRALDAQRYTPADLQAAWEWLGPEFNQRGAERVGIMLPRRFMASKDRQRELGALFVLARRPELADKFPSLANQYPVPESNEKAAEEWKERLLDVAKDTPDPVDIAEVLKTMLRRLAATSRPIIDPAVYIRFVQQEHAASYPRQSYDTMLIPQLDQVVIRLLSAVFEVVAAIALHSEKNAMSAGRLCHLFGWWLLGSVPDGTTDWNGLYQAYRLAGQRTEHLFYARLRWQTTQQKMPRRLVQLILSYPFGESSASSEHLPLPPASTFPRSVLHVALGTDSALPTGTDPAKVLGDALIARLDDDVTAPKWVTLRTRDDRAVTLEDMLSEDSQAFLDELSHAKGLELTSPPATPNEESDDEQKYHPFSANQERVTTRRRSASWGDAPRLEMARHSVHQSTLGPVAESPTGSTASKRSVTRMTSAVNLSPTKVPAEWSDFAVSGFGESPEGVRDLSLSLKKPRTPVRYAKLVTPEEKNKFRISGETPSTSYVVVSEEVVEIDDAFLHFVEDGQLDPVASSSWPRFALVQLATPVPGPTDGPVDWLLVTVKKREVKRAPSLEEPLPDLRLMESRPSLSTTDSQMSRFGSAFGLASLTKSFRRRSSFLGSHSSRSGKQVLGPVVETRRGHQSKDSAVSDCPTEYTIGEMGEIVKIPSSQELAERAEGSSVLTRTAASDWIYLAEGGAHAVFRYRGADASLQGKVIRLVKQATGGEPDVALRETWKYKLLPEVVPASLLATTTPTPVTEQWARGVVTPTEMLRPTARRTENTKALADIIDYTVPAQLMDDLLGGIPDSKVLAIEIKPKWGFLPSSENITPPAAAEIKSKNCRFCLHQHYKGDEAHYCPLDLYSGDRARVRLALDGLWKQWHASDGEKNNLRVFVDGVKILPSNAAQIPTRGGSLTEGTADFLLPLLEQTEILSHLQSLQTLDAVDISTLAAEYKAANPGVDLFSTVQEPTIAELTDFIAVHKDPTAWTPRQRQIAYALSAIFKDCSVIIRAVLRPTADGYELNSAKSSVRVIDTDLKPLTRLRKWFELDEKIWRHWADTKETKDAAPVAPATKAIEVAAPTAVESSVEPTRIEAEAASVTSPSREAPPATKDSHALAAGVGVGVGAAALAGVAAMYPKASSTSSTPKVEEANDTLKEVTPPPAVEAEKVADLPVLEKAQAVDVAEAPVEVAAPIEAQLAKPVDPIAASVETNDVEPPVKPVEDVDHTVKPDERATPIAPVESVPPVDPIVAHAESVAPAATLASVASVPVAPEAIEQSKIAEPEVAAEATKQIEQTPAAASPEVQSIAPAVERTAAPSTDATVNEVKQTPAVEEEPTPAAVTAAVPIQLAAQPPAVESAPVEDAIVSREVAPLDNAAPESQPVETPIEKAAPAPVVSNDVAAVPATSGATTPATPDPEAAVSHSKTAGLEALGVAAGVGGAAAAVVAGSHPRTASQTSLTDTKRKGGRLSSLFNRKTSGKGEITPTKEKDVPVSLSPGISPRSLVSPSHSPKSPLKSPLSDARTSPKPEKRASKESSDSFGSGFASRFRKGKKGTAVGVAGAGAAAGVVAAKAVGKEERVPTPADEMKDPFAKDVVGEVGQVSEVEPVTPITEAAIVSPVSDTPIASRISDVPIVDPVPETSVEQVAIPEATAISETPSAENATEVSDTKTVEETKEAEALKQTIDKLEKPKPTALELPDDSLNNVNIGSAALPRLSAFGDDIPQPPSTPPPHDISESPTTPSMVPTKAPDSPTDATFRRSDTSFPRLSAFGPPGGVPLDFDKKESAVTEVETPTAAVFASDVAPKEPAVPATEMTELTLPAPEVAPEADPAAAVEKSTVDEVKTEAAPAPEAAIPSGEDLSAPTPEVLASPAATTVERPVSPHAKESSKPQDKLPAAGIVAAGGAAALATVAALSSRDSVVSNADSDSSLNDARRKRSSAPSPSPGLASSLSNEVEPFEADLAGVQEESEHAELEVPPVQPLGVVMPLAPVEDTDQQVPAVAAVEEVKAVAQHVPAAEVVQEAKASAIAAETPAPSEDASLPAEKALSITPLSPAAEDAGSGATPTIAIRRAAAESSSPVGSLSVDPSHLEVDDDDEPKPISPPAHVEHYKHAELPPLPPSTSGGSNFDADDGSLTSSNSPFVTAPVTPAGLTADEGESVADVTPHATEEVSDFPIHSPTPPMMHAAAFPPSSSNRSFGARSVSATSAGTVSSVMSAQPSVGLNISAPTFVPLAGAEVDKPAKTTPSLSRPTVPTSASSELENPFPTTRSIEQDIAEETK